jgi:DNA-binding MarR family transcriptional regulator
MQPSEAAATADLLRRLANKGINTITEARLLLNAAAAPGSTLTELARRLKLPMSSVSRCVYDLVKLGLIEYEAKAGDRRAKVLRANVKQL